MKHDTLKNLTATALLFVLSGAFFACLTFGTIPSDASSHAGHASQSTNDVAVGHIAHAQELSLSPVSSLFAFDLAIVLAFLVVFLPFLTIRTRKISDIFSLEFPLRARKRSAHSKQEQRLVAYISRFVRSPEFM